MYEFYMIKNIKNYLKNNNSLIYITFDKSKIKNKMKEDFKKVKIK
jgi:hypothetical protein